MFVCLTDNAANACERHFQLLRLRGERSKQPALAETPYGRPGFNGHPLHGCAWTMLRQIKLQQPEQDFRILHGNRKLECAFEHVRSFLPEVAFHITVFMHLRPRVRRNSSVASERDTRRAEICSRSRLRTNTSDSISSTESSNSKLSWNFSGGSTGTRVRITSPRASR